MGDPSGEATGSGQRFGSSPHYQTLEEAVHHRTPIWLSKLLKTRFEDDVPLEDLFANCWVLYVLAFRLNCALVNSLKVQYDDYKVNCRGRVADAIFSFKDDKPYQCPPQNLGERPYKAVVQDIERFFLLCEILNIREDSRISLADVEQKRAGTQIGLCLWDISNAIHEKSGTEGFPVSLKSNVPDFAECERYFGYRQGNTPDRWNLASKFETGRNSPIKFPKDSRHLVPSGLSGNEHRGDQTEEYDDGMDGPTQVLASILSPGRKKASHSKVMNAIMMTHADDVEKEDAGERREEKSPFPKIIDTNDGHVKIEKSQQRENKEKKELDANHANGRHDELEKRQDGKESMLWHQIVIFASGAVVAAIGSVVFGVVADRKRKQRDMKMHGRW